MINTLLRTLKLKAKNNEDTKTPLVVKAVIIKEDEAELIPYVLLGFEKDTNKWKFVGGKVEENETLKEALFREVLEETGLALTDGNIDGEPYKYDVGGKEIYVYFIKHNGDMPNEIGDIDQEFKKLDWFPIGMVVKGKIDLAFPVNENVCVDALIKRYKDFLNTREGVQIDEVQTDETNKKLSFKEKRELTKQFFELRDKIKATKNFKEKRELTKKFFKLRDKILGLKTENEDKQKTEDKKAEKKVCEFKFDATSDPRKAYPYVAKIVLKNGRIDRQFFDLHREYGRNEISVFGTYKVKNGDIVEEQTGGSWKNKYRDFYYIDGCKKWHIGKATEVETKKRVIKFLSGEIGVDELLDKWTIDDYKEWKQKQSENQNDEKNENSQSSNLEQGKDEIISKAKEILSKDDLTLDDLDFFTPEVLKHLDEKEKEGDPEALELENIVKDKLQKLESELQKDGIDFDEIGYELDSIEGEKLSTLLEKMFTLRKAKSKKNENDKLKAFKELQKLVETDPNIRDLLEVLVEELKTYTDEADINKGE